AGRQQHLGAAKAGCPQFGDPALADKPGAVDPDEVAGFDPPFELADRSTHQMRAIMRVDGDIVVLAAHAVDGIDSDLHDTVRGAKPKLGLKFTVAVLCGGGSKVSHQSLQFRHPVFDVVDLEPVSGSAERALETLALDRLQKIVHRAV